MVDGAGAGGTETGWSAKEETTSRLWLKSPSEIDAYLDEVTQQLKELMISRLLDTSPGIKDEGEMIVRREDLGMDA